MSVETRLFKREPSPPRPLKIPPEPDEEELAEEEAGFFFFFLPEVVLPEEVFEPPPKRDPKRPPSRPPEPEEESVFWAVEVPTLPELPSREFSSRGAAALKILLLCVWETPLDWATLC